MEVCDATHLERYSYDDRIGYSHRCKC